jgi:hypothetical protein
MVAASIFIFLNSRKNNKPLMEYRGKIGGKTGVEINRILFYFKNLTA